MFTHLKHLHFLGVCGTAMGAVAAALPDVGGDCQAMRAGV